MGNGVMVELGSGSVYQHADCGAMCIDKRDWENHVFLARPYAKLNLSTLHVDCGETRAF